MSLAGWSEEWQDGVSYSSWDFGMQGFMDAGCLWQLGSWDANVLGCSV